jgi:hypothetical protein
MLKRVNLPYCRGKDTSVFFIPIIIFFPIPIKDGNKRKGGGLAI